MDIGGRIKKLRESKGMKRPALAAIIGVEPNTIYRYEVGVFGIKDETKERIATALGTTVSYLIGETDDPSPPMSANTSNKHNVVESNIKSINPVHMIRVRILDKHYRVCCGSGLDWGSEAVEYESSMLIDAPDLATRYSSGDIIGTYAEGDSMEPNICDGDLVLFVPHEKEVIYAGVPMVVVYNSRMIVRGVIVNARNRVTLKAHNKEYADIIVTPDDDFEICGRVVDIHARKKPVSVI